MSQQSGNEIAPVMPSTPVAIMLSNTKQSADPTAGVDRKVHIVDDT